MNDIYLFLIGMLVITLVVRFVPYIIKYNKSNYKVESGVGLFKFLFDTGSFGEALIFFELEKLPMYSKIMANLYIPTEDGTTEIDVLYIAPSGIYVIESKNYSGWIFGDEKARNWTAVIYKTKNKFLNPIWQNKKHIKYLSKVLVDVQLRSLIVFSERCELKRVNVKEDLVIKRGRLRKVILKESEKVIFSNQEIDAFYNKLKGYSNKSEEEKRLHIEQVRK
ncbi:MAG: NERD domain-containing protein [Erysipelothrix sp.]|nr:NERD domain-containing protein [Erysipelothrix sp.]